MSGTSIEAPYAFGTAALLLVPCTFDTAGLRRALLESVGRVPASSGAPRLASD